MTNYNDGLWHGWNGGECPVRPESIIEIVSSGGNLIKMAANYGAWDHPTMQLIAFRVVAEHKEPREFWIDLKTGVACSYGNVSGMIHVREVIE